MSHRCNDNIVVADPQYGGVMAGLIIFILIILQFGKRKGGINQLFDNSTLFILVLFCVACCGKVKLGC